MEEVKKIEIRSHFGDWREVSFEKAREFIKHRLAGITTGKTKDAKIKMIEGKYLRGITVEELGL